MAKLLFLLILTLVFTISCSNEALKASEVSDSGVNSEINLKPTKLQKQKDTSKTESKLDLKAQNNKKLTNTDKNDEVLVKKAEDLLSKGDYLMAMLTLKKIKESSKYYTRARTGIKKAQEQYKEYRFTKAQEAFKKKDYKAASSYLKALVKKYPKFDEAIELKEKVDKELKNIK